VVFSSSNLKSWGNNLIRIEKFIPLLYTIFPTGKTDNMVIFDVLKSYDGKEDFDYLNLDDNTIYSFYVFRVSPIANKTIMYVYYDYTLKDIFQAKLKFYLFRNM
jgi:hypothetical protein